MEKSYYNAESLGRVLLDFERRYSLASADFYAKVEADEPLDMPGFDRNVWASIYRDYRRMSGGDFAMSVSRALELA